MEGQGVGRRYSLTEKVDVLADFVQDGSIRRTAERHGVSTSTLQTWLRAPELSPHLERMRRDLVDASQDVLRAIVQRAAEQTLARLPEASARDAAVVMGIASDKLRQLAEMRPAADQPGELFSDESGVYAEMERLLEQRKRTLNAIADTAGGTVQ